MALDGLHPGESCPLWLNNAAIACLSSKCSRHNAPSRAHDLTKTIRRSTSGTNESIVVRFWVLNKLIIIIFL